MATVSRSTTERRRSKKRREEVSDKITPEEYAVAKYLRQKLPNKKTMLFNHKVDYFVASKAIDCLLDSPFAVRNKSKETLFTTRESVVEFLYNMLVHKFFHRARKIVVAAKDSSKKKKKDESSDEKDKDVKKKKKSDKDDDKSKDGDGKGKEGDAKGKDGDTKAGKKDKKKEEDEKKKKKKLKLDMHLEQLFVDGSEVYVWIYDPIPMKAWVIGGVLVIGAIVLCLFPLWPQSVRKGVYYLSIAAAGFLVFILSLAVLRLLVFCIVWAVTFGKHHLWLFPNLTEDVGFFESFWPLYKYEYKGAGEADGKDEGEGEEDDDEAKKSGGQDDDGKKQLQDDDDDDDRNLGQSADSDKKNEDSEEGNEGGGASRDSSSDRSDDNEFEVLDAEEAHRSGESDS